MTGVFDAIGAVAEALAKLTTAVTPFLNERLAQRYETEQRDYMLRWQTVARRGDAAGVQRFVDRLCADCGHPTGFLDDTSIEVPVAHFDQLVQCAIEYRRVSRELASLQRALKSS